MPAFDSMFVIVCVVVVLALAFDFINGFHDTANAIAASVSTRAMTPADGNHSGGRHELRRGDHVHRRREDDRRQGGRSGDTDHGVQIVIATLISAIAWNLITWWYGIPSSSSHALIGSLAGAVIASEGFGGVNASGFTSIVHGAGFLADHRVCRGLYRHDLFKLIFAAGESASGEQGLPLMQILTACFQSFTHGTNDAQKAMGIITMALVAAQYQDSLEVPLWVKFSAALGDGARDKRRRMEDHQDDGDENFQDRAGERLCGGYDGGERHHDGDGDGAAGEHDARHHVGHPRRRQREAVLERELGRCRAHRVRVDHHDPDFGRDRGDRVRDYRVFVPVSACGEPLQGVRMGAGCEGFFVGRGAVPVQGV